MKPRIAFLFVLFIAVAAFAADATGPEPDPWWRQVEKTQSLALQWLGALTVIGGALATFIAFVIGKVNELKARVEKQADRSDVQQQQIHELALKAPATGSGQTNVIENNPKP